MKKYIFIAAAALAAATACSKVETVETPAQEISFQVASYLPQTRADEVQGTNFKAECDYFFTNAYYNGATYMDNVKVVLGNGAWAPEGAAYYWPRTGTVNFFSYASKNDLPTSELTAGNATFKITGHKVVESDNIMIADAVYGAGRTDHNADGNQVKDNLAEGTTDSGYKGVPTLFRHLLSQVSFKLGLVAGGNHAGTNYEAKITSAKVVKVANTGDLTLSNNGSGTSLTMAAWTPASDGTQVGWTVSTGEGVTEDLTLTTPTTLTLAEGATAGETVEVLAFRTVLPQTLTNDVEIQITFDLDTKHGTTTYIHEEGIVVSAKLNSIEAIPSWNMNQRIIYTVTIDPVTETVTFDPAVAAWVETTATAINIPVPNN